MEDFGLLVLATFWAWETVRYASETYLGVLFEYSRPLHPLLVLALPLWVLWPDWIAAAAVAALVGLLHQVVGLFSSSPAPVEFRGRRRGRLPNLP